MLRRVLLYLFLIAVLSATFVLWRRVTSALPDAQVAASPAAPTHVVGAPAAERDPFPPDARFLDAIGEIDHALTGAAPRRAQATWRAGVWTLAVDRREVGRVPEFPTFAELEGVLVAWARACGARESLAAAPPAPATVAGIESQLAGLRAMRAADLADRAWAAGHHELTTARLGARALVWLDAECFDGAGAGEAIPARALAWCAITTAMDSTALASERALLAERMGYAAEACTRAARPWSATSRNW